MSKRFALLAALALAVLASPAALAQESNFKIFAAVAYVSPLDSSDVSFEDVEQSVEASNEMGWMVGAEWRMTKLLGLQADYLMSTHDVEAEGDAVAEVDMSPLSAALNFHLIPGETIDVYVGAVASYVMWGDVEFDDATEIPTDDEIAYGVQVGLDFNLGERFAIVGGLRYLMLDVTEDTSDGEEVGVDPLFATVGVAFRF